MWYYIFTVKFIDADAKNAQNKTIFASVICKRSLFITSGRKAACFFMDKIMLNSHAKINLSLDVTAKRDDGYHEVSMIMVSCGLCDSIVIEKKGGGIELETNLKFLPSDERNIAYKAAEEFFSYCSLDGGAKIQIFKRIPVGAGLAGGSGNGAAVLCGLDKLYNTHLSIQQLCEIGRRLGADVPYCICGGTALAEGIGEKLTPLKPLPKTPLVLIKPSFSVSTPAVYKQIDSTPILRRPDTPSLISALERGDIRSLAGGMVNVMEEVSIKNHPIIGKIKNDLLKSGALGALMSGSGPSVFALFESYNDAKKAAAPYKNHFFTYVGWTK